MHCVICFERMISPKDEREMRKGISKRKRYTGSSLSGTGLLDGMQILNKN